MAAKRVEKQKTARRDISSSQALGPGPVHPPTTVPLEVIVGVPLSNRSNSARRRSLLSFCRSRQGGVRSGNHNMRGWFLFLVLLCRVVWVFFARLSAFPFVSVGGGCGHCCRRCPCYGNGGLCPSAIPVARPGPGLRGSTRVGLPPICLDIMSCGDGIAWWLWCE
jgi:hypothetical protein